MHANFIEDPPSADHRISLYSQPLRDMSISIFIETSYATFIKPEFREWISTLTTRLGPEAQGIAISIKPKTVN